MKKKAQVWSLDLIIAIVLFTVAILIFYTYGSNLVKVDEDKTAYLLQDAKTISGFLVQGGVPDNWTSTDVITIGVTNDNFIINTTKLQAFSQLAVSNYSGTKQILSTRADYFIFFENKNGTYLSINGVSGIGKSGINQTNIYEIQNPDQAITLYRFVLYNREIIKLGILVW